MSSRGSCRALEQGKPCSFLRVILEEFPVKLHLPRAFAAAIVGLEKWETAALRSNHVQRRWQVDVRGDGKDLHLTGIAWESFAEAHDLQRGDLLVFSQEGEAVFGVDVFDLSTCVRNYSNPTLSGLRSCDSLVPGKPTSFFRVLLEEFHEKLLLPREFVAGVLEVEKWERTTIRSTLLDRSWRVKVQGDGQDRYFTGHAWESFVQAHGLQIGYFLVFSHKGEGILTTTVFDLSTCCKSYSNHTVVEEMQSTQANSPSKMKRGRTEKRKEFRTTSVTEGQFELRVNFADARYQDVPRDVVKRFGLRGKHRVLLRNSQGRWPVLLRSSRHGRGIRFYLITEYVLDP